MRARRQLPIGAFLALVLCLAGCGRKTTSLQGKVVDGHGNPVCGLKVAAKQVEPVNGYDYFETVTEADGTFRFNRLFPASEYDLLLWIKDWSDAPRTRLRWEPSELNYVVNTNRTGWVSSRALRVQSGPLGERMLLPAEIVLQPEASIIAGSVVDGASKPLAGLRIEAKSIRPIKGYEQCETFTGSDGTFRLDRLCPLSQYVLTPWPETWSTETIYRIESGPAGETVILDPPMVIRFMASSNGVITDSLTGLQWIVGPDRKMNYPEAEQWVSDCDVAGGGWRMPTRLELSTLYQKRVTWRNMDPAFKTTGLYVWAEPRDASSAWMFFFGTGSEAWYSRNTPGNFRAFGVRSCPQE